VGLVFWFVVIVVLVLLVVCGFFTWFELRGVLVYSVFFVVSG